MGSTRLTYEFSNQALKISYLHHFSTIDNTPYRFNGKEIDPETGNQYYGARYYDPKISVWLSVDPLAHKYPSLSAYNFVANNPVHLIDPDGRSIDWGANLFGAVRAVGSLMLTKRGRDHLKMMVNDKTTLYAFDYSKQASVGQKADGTFGMAEGTNVTSNAPDQTGKFRSLTTIYLGTFKAKKAAMKLAGVNDWSNLSDANKNRFLNLAINQENISIAIFSQQNQNTSNQRGGGFLFTFQNRPDLPPTLPNEAKWQFSHRVLVHETTHGLMMGGKKLWQNAKENRNSESMPYKYETAATNQVRRKRKGQ